MEWVFVGHNPGYSPFDDSPEKFYKCSNCGYITGRKTPYCPICGSREKKKNGEEKK